MKAGIFHRDKKGKRRFEAPLLSQIELVFLLSSHFLWLWKMLVVS